ncbi:MAG: hypothetical protein ACT4P4_28460 [Betaproteobacteria bacterium]
MATGRVEPWHLVAGNLVLGVVNACDAPARQSILIHLVGGKADLPNAIALSSLLAALAYASIFPAIRRAIQPVYNNIGI